MISENAHQNENPSGWSFSMLNARHGRIFRGGKPEVQAAPERRDGHHADVGGLRESSARCPGAWCPGVLAEAVRRADLLESLKIVLGGPPAEERSTALVTVHTLRERRTRTVVSLVAEDDEVNTTACDATARNTGIHKDRGSERSSCRRSDGRTIVRRHSDGGVQLPVQGGTWRRRR